MEGRRTIVEIHRVVFKLGLGLDDIQGPHSLIYTHTGIAHIIAGHGHGVETDIVLRIGTGDDSHLGSAVLQPSESSHVVDDDIYDATPLLEPAAMTANVSTLELDSDASKDVVASEASFNTAEEIMSTRQPSSVLADTTTEHAILATETTADGAGDDSILETYTNELGTDQAILATEDTIGDRAGDNSILEKTYVDETAASYARRMEAQNWGTASARSCSSSGSESSVHDAITVISHPGFTTPPAAEEVDDTITVISHPGFTTPTGAEEIDDDEQTEPEGIDYQGIWDEVKAIQVDFQGKAETLTVREILARVGRLATIRNTTDSIITFGGLDEGVLGTKLKLPEKLRSATTVDRVLIFVEAKTDCEPSMVISQG